MTSQKYTKKFDSFMQEPAKFECLKFLIEQLTKVRDVKLPCSRNWGKKNHSIRELSEKNARLKCETCARSKQFIHKAILSSLGLSNGVPGSRVSEQPSALPCSKNPTFTL